MPWQKTTQYPHLVVEESLPGTLGKVFPKSLKHSLCIMEMPSVIEDDVLCTWTTAAVCRAAALNAQVTKWESTMPISTCFPKLQELLRIFHRLKQHWCSKSSEPCIKQESGTRPYFQIHMQIRVLPTEDGSPVVLVWHQFWQPSRGFGLLLWVNTLWV